MQTISMSPISGFLRLTLPAIAILAVTGLSSLTIYSAKGNAWLYDSLVLLIWFYLSWFNPNPRSPAQMIPPTLLAQVIPHPKAPLAVLPGHLLCPLWGRVGLLATGAGWRGHSKLSHIRWAKRLGTPFPITSHANPLASGSSYSSGTD